MQVEMACRAHQICNLAKHIKLMTKNKGITKTQYDRMIKQKKSPEYIIKQLEQHGISQSLFGPLAVELRAFIENQKPILN